MSDPKLTTRQVREAVAPLADHIREVAAQHGEVRDGFIDWKKSKVSFSEPVKDALMEALKVDLYIAPDESLYILEKAGDNHTFVSALLTNLRVNPPLFSRLEVLQKNCSKQGTCDENKLPIGIELGLQQAIVHDYSVAVSDRAKEYLAQLNGTLDE